MEKEIRKRLKKSQKITLTHIIFRIFPIKKRKIVFTSFEGSGGYACNPRYIAEEFLRRNQSYELLWLVNDKSKQFPKGIKKVKNTPLALIFHLSTAKIWVDNTRKPLGTVKRKGQIYVQTWHGMIGPKAVGLYRGELFPKIAQVISQKDSDLIDIMLSNSKWCTDVRPKMLLYSGEIIETGSPRNDILINQREKLYKSMRKQYNIPENSKILLFAPTFRGGSQQGKRSIYSQIPAIDFNVLLESLEEKFSGEWYLFLRMHPQLSAQMDKMPLDSFPKRCVDVSKEDDMNQLLAMCDAFMSDYSSSAYDALLLKIPIFLYAEDLSEYETERGELMYNIREQAFPCAENHEELMENIRNFHENQYKIALEQMILDFGIKEDGSASKKVVDLLEERI